jgi:hypothetical protein
MEAPHFLLPSFPKAETEWRTAVGGCLTLIIPRCYKGLLYFHLCGAVAQLGARLDGIEEVRGSNPLGSTNISSGLRLMGWFGLQ